MCPSFNKMGPKFPIILLLLSLSFFKGLSYNKYCCDIHFSQSRFLKVLRTKNNWTNPPFPNPSLSEWSNFVLCCFPFLCEFSGLWSTYLKSLGYMYLEFRIF